MRIRALPAAIRNRVWPPHTGRRVAAARVRPYVIRTALTPPPPAPDIETTESPVRPYVLAHERARDMAEVAA